MTRDRDFKREVRARMRATGERYTQARRALHEPARGSFVSPRPDSKRGTPVERELLELLERDGYAVVRNVVPRELVAELRRWVDGEIEDDLAWRLNEKQRRRDAGEHDVRAFARWSEGRFSFKLPRDWHEQLASLVAAIADAVGLALHGSGGAEACLPGWGGHEGLHCDLDGTAPAVGEWDGAVFTFPLDDDWTGMRVVPGSHHEEPVFRGGYAPAIAPYAGEVHVNAAAGDAVINSIHIWKSATLNGSSETRREIWMGFSRDESVGQRIKEYWAKAEIVEDGMPLDPGNYVHRD